MVIIFVVRQKVDLQPSFYFGARIPPEVRDFIESVFNLHLFTDTLRYDRVEVENDLKTGKYKQGQIFIVIKSCVNFMTLVGTDCTNLHMTHSLHKIGSYNYVMIFVFGWHDPNHT